MKTPGWQSHPERYDLRHTLALQYAHLDTIRHVNNVAVHGLHVEARIRYQLAVLGQAHLFSDTVLLRPRRTLTQFLRSQPVIIILGEAQAPKVIEQFSGAIYLNVMARCGHRAAAVMKITVDAFFGERVTCPRDQTGEFLSCCDGQDPGVIDKGGAALESAHQPAAVSSRRAVPDTLCLNQYNVSVRLDVL